MNLPTTCKDYFESFLGPEVTHKMLDFMQHGEVLQGVRKNTLIKSQDTSVHLQKVKWLANGYSHAVQGIGNTPEYQCGLLYSQEIASQLAVELLEPKSQEIVLDLCSSPGSKTTQISAHMKNSGFLVANEVDKKRAQTLKHNLSHFGVMNSAITTLDASYFATYYANTFDRILVDAPCSGEGMFFKFPNVMTHWNKKTIIFNMKRQIRILSEAFKALRKGGRLVYSTCTLNREENEGVIEALINRYPGAVRVVPASKVLKNLPVDFLTHDQMIRVLPHLQSTGGFFACLIEKTMLTEVDTPNMALRMTDKKKLWKKAGDMTCTPSMINFDHEDFECREYLGKIFVQPKIYYKNFYSLPVIALGIAKKDLELFQSV